MKRNALMTNGGLYKQPSLKVSQNFITSKRILMRLLQRTTINRQDDVIEIGPGKGHITSLLIEKSHHVTAVEIDEYLFCKLYSFFHYNTNFKEINRMWQSASRNVVNDGKRSS